MRHPDDIPDGPWPPDMVLGIEECWSPLTFLLFVRSAWRLPIETVPPLESEPSVGDSVRPVHLNQDEAISIWLRDWERAWTHFESPSLAVTRPDAQTQHLLDTLSDDELWEAMSTEPSPLWNQGIDRNAHEVWRMSQHVKLGRLPEHNVVPALVEAWESGLTTIIQLPYAGYFGERINREHLVVSSVTRHDPEQFARALVH